MWCLKALLDFQAIKIFNSTIHKSNQSLIHGNAADDGAFLKQFKKKPFIVKKSLQIVQILGDMLELSIKAKHMIVTNVKKLSQVIHI